MSTYKIFHYEGFSMLPLEISRYFGRFRIGLLLTVLTLPCIGWAQQPMVIPQPRELQTQHENFKVTTDLQIVLLPVLSEEDRYAAQSIAQELRTVTEQDFPIVSSTPGANSPAIVLGRL